MGTSLAAMRAVVHALRGWPTPYAAALNTTEPLFGDGGPHDEETAWKLQLVARQVIEFAQMRLRFDNDRGDAPASERASA
jgi:FMN reductase